MRPSERGTFFVTAECETCGQRSHVSDLYRLKLRGPDGGFGYTCRDWRTCAERRRRNRGYTWVSGEAALHLFPANVGRAA